MTVVRYRSYPLTLSQEFWQILQNATGLFLCPFENTVVTKGAPCGQHLLYYSSGFLNLRGDNRLKSLKALFNFVLQIQQTDDRLQIITKQFTIVGGFQILTINREWRVATIEQRSNHGSWKTIWNYNRVSGKQQAFSGDTRRPAPIKLTKILDLFLYPQHFESKFWGQN